MLGKGARYGEETGELSRPSAKGSLIKAADKTGISDWRKRHTIVAQEANDRIVA